MKMTEHLILYSDFKYDLQLYSKQMRSNKIKKENRHYVAAILFLKF